MDKSICRSFFGGELTEKDLHEQYEKLIHYAATKEFTELNAVITPLVNNSGPVVNVSLLFLTQQDSL